MFERKQDRLHFSCRIKRENQFVQNCGLFFLLQIICRCQPGVTYKSVIYNTPGRLLLFVENYERLRFQFYTRYKDFYRYVPIGK